MRPGNGHYDAFIKESNFALANWQKRTADHQSAIIQNVRDEGHSAAEQITQLRSLFGNIVNFEHIACGAVAVFSQSILKTQPFLLLIPVFFVGG